MGVYINMEMPQIEGNRGIKAEIRQLDGKFEFGIMTGGYSCCEQWTFYPIVPVPEHGRLIDADAFVQSIRDVIHYDASRGREYISAEDLQEALTNAPTIIPADPEKR